MNISKYKEIKTDNFYLLKIIYKIFKIFGIIDVSLKKDYASY
jgi:hypothetical protein